MQRRPYGAPQQGGPVRPHRGVMLIVFAILGWTVCGIFSIVALVMASTDRKLIRQGMMDRAGEGLTNAAYWLSLIGLILGAIGVIMMILFFAVFASTAPQDDYRYQPQPRTRSPYGKVAPMEPKLAPPEWVA
jgi:hypothetical protein